MASIYKEISIAASPQHVWSAVRDIGAVHRRLAPGFVVDTRLDGDARVVTFANGTVVREVIVAIDDDLRRLAWTIVGWQATHHNGTMQVFADADDGDRSRLVWITDLLPNDLADRISVVQDQGMAVIKRTLERQVVT